MHRCWAENTMGNKIHRWWCANLPPVIGLIMMLLFDFIFKGSCRGEGIAAG